MSGPARPGPWFLPRWALVLGVAAGLAEVLGFGIDRYVFGRIIGVGPHVVWMAPLALTCGLTGVALVLALGARLRGGQPGPAALGTVLFLASATLTIYVHPRIHWVAALVLAAGVAVQGTRLALRHLTGLARLLRWMAPASLALVVLLAAGTFGWEAWRGARERARVGSGVPPGAPNVLFVVWDTVRADHLSLHGYTRPTSPRLAAFAAGGVAFARAIATAPWTAPTHASLFTGRWPRDLGITWRRPLGDEITTLAESLQASGYDTAAFVANTFGCTYERGLSQGFAQYHDHPVSAEELARSTALVRAALDAYPIRRAVGRWEMPSRQRADALNASLLAWLDQRGPGPFFAFVNYFDAHDPYLPPPPYDALYGTGPRRNPWLVRRRSDTTSWTAADLARERDAYDGAITYVDAQFGALADALEQRGLLANTLVVVTSDHGEEFGEHGKPGHGHTLFMEQLHVPLVLRLPGRVPSGVSVAHAVSLRDVPATVWRVLGLSGDGGLKGRALDTAWQPGGGAGPGAVRADLDQNSAIVDGQYHYIRGARGRERLFDLNADPLEQRDLAGTEAGRALLPALRRALDASMSQHGAGTPER